MTLTLKDLFVSTDVSTPAPRAATAHAHAPSDPFAVFFSHPGDHDAAPDSAPPDSSTAAPSSQATAPSPKDHHTNRADNARDSDANDGAPRSHHKSRPDSTAPTPADDARAADRNKASRDAATTDNKNSNTATTASDAPAAPINLFQVALLAAQADASNAADQSAPATPQVSATPAIGPVTADTAAVTAATAAAAPMPTADMTALLAAGQDVATALPTPTALPVDLNAPENLPAVPTSTAPITPTAGDIAILSMASQPPGQAANVVPAPRPTDNRIASTATQTSTGPSTRASGASRPQNDDLVKTDASSSTSAPSESATLPPDPTVVPFVPASADMMPSADDAAAQASDPSIGAVGSNVVPTGIATAQQAQTLYTKTASRTDALPQVTVDQVAMHLTKAVDDGIDHLTIHLKPAELGSIEVKLEMGDTGISKATITADRQDTLNLLQRDSHRLEQALDNAGLKADPGSLSFNLRGDGGRYSPNFSQGNGSPYSPFAGKAADDATPSVNPALLGYINSRAALGGVDIRV